MRNYKELARKKRVLAGAGGFEPPYGGIKIRCLTAWRRPNSPTRQTQNLADLWGRTIVTAAPMGKRDDGFFVRLPQIRRFSGKS